VPTSFGLSYPIHVFQLSVILCTFRVITLLSLPQKLMAKVLLERMKDAIEASLKQEQAGFRKGRSCCEQIFVLRQVIEKVQR